MEDWYSIPVQVHFPHQFITRKTIKQQGGGGILSLHESSLHKTLKAVYPGLFIGVNSYVRIFVESS